MRTALAFVAIALVAIWLTQPAQAVTIIPPNLVVHVPSNNADYRFQQTFVFSQVRVSQTSLTLSQLVLSFRATAGLMTSTVMAFYPGDSTQTIIRYFGANTAYPVTFFDFSGLQQGQSYTLLVDSEVFQQTGANALGAISFRYDSWGGVPHTFELMYGSPELPPGPGRKLVPQDLLWLVIFLVCIVIAVSIIRRMQKEDKPR